MSRFDETVQKLAHSPLRHIALGAVASCVVKEAGFSDIAQKVFGGQTPTGGQQIARNLASAAITGGGAYLVGKGLDRMDSSSERLQAQRSQMGRMQGEHSYRQRAVKKLSPMHDEVYMRLQQDPTIAKADPELMASSYATMKRFAPYLATDPNAALSFLRENAIYGTGPSYASLKNLADTEQSVSHIVG